MSMNISIKLNISFFFKLMASISKAKKIISDFNPDIVIGVGGFASGPVLRVATRRKIPTLIQEQNSYAGVTNKILSSRVNVICVAYDEMDKYFPAGKIVYTGNPVRKDLLNVDQKREEGLINFNFRGNRKVLLVLGGSLGSRTLNQSIHAGLGKLIDNKVQVIWQTGKEYYQVAKEMVASLHTDDIHVYDFINRMDLVYAIADVIISRAGAGTIAELCIVAKPVILVPSPNVAEDHQTKNAMALIKINAAMMVEDKNAHTDLVRAAIDLLNDEFRMNVYKENVAKMAVKNSANLIANEIIKLVNNKRD